MNRILIPVALFLFVSGIAVVGVFRTAVGAARRRRAADPVQPSRARRHQQNSVPVLPRICAALGQLGRPADRALCRLSRQCVARRYRAGHAAVDRRVSSRRSKFAGIASTRFRISCASCTNPISGLVWQCQECHGPVQTMDRIEPVHEINMGFCIDCHTKRGATQECFVCHH